MWASAAQQQSRVLSAEKMLLVGAVEVSRWGWGVKATCLNHGSNGRRHGRLAVRALVPVAWLGWKLQETVEH